MSPRRRKRFFLLSALLVLFTVISAIAVDEFGYLALWRLTIESSGTVQLFADLCIAMLLVTSWILKDARREGRTAWPYLLITVAAGSFGPLLYLLVGELNSDGGRDRS